MSIRSASRANVWLAVLSWVGTAALGCAPGGRRHLAFHHAVRQSPHRKARSTRLHSTRTFKTLEGNDIHAAEEVVKKSRFIGYASHWCVRKSRRLNCRP